MKLYYCDVSDRRVLYLRTPLYNALFKWLIKEYNFSYKDFIENIHGHTLTDTYSLPITCECELSFLQKMLFRKTLFYY